MSTSTDWYSDEALRKQALADELNARGEPVPLDVMCGILAPRVQPTEAEECANCGCDARAEVGGEEHGGKRWCGICLGRGRHERHLAESRQRLSGAVQAIREWCDKTEAAAHAEPLVWRHSEAVFQARMDLVDEVRALLPSAEEAEQARKAVTP